MILLEGEEKAGKSWAAALLSASPKVGITYWIDLGEGAADEYGAVPGARYEVIEHSGDYHDVLSQIVAVKAEAARIAEAGEPPVVLVIDSMTDLWEGLKDWASARARKSHYAKQLLAKDPNADIPVSMNLWNDAGARYRKVMTQLLTFPGIVVITAKGKEVTPLTEDGKPKERAPKEYRVEGHKSMPYDATMWVRMYRTQKPVVVGARSVKHGIRPGKDDPSPIDADPENLLEWLVFDVLGCDPATAHVREIQHVAGGDLTEDERAGEAAPGGPATDPTWLADMQQDIGTCQTEDALLAFWPQIVTAVKESRCAPADGEALKDRIKMRRGQLNAAKGSAA
jgi:hypothetical protein